jgi:glucosylceramidase
MKTIKPIILIFTLALLIMGCEDTKLSITVYETSKSGHKLTQITNFEAEATNDTITLLPNKTFQTITGIGGSFTESSAYLLNRLSKFNRTKVLEAYFGEDGANYSLTRTHIASCDFSLNNYTYAPVEGDVELQHFSVKEDQDDLIPMIKEAIQISKEGFKIIASPWSAAPWMKDNNKYVGGKLQPEYYSRRH